MKKICKPILKAEVIVLAIVIFTKIIHFFCLDFNYTADSYEYIARNGFDIFSGVIDRYRLPVYPMLLDIFSNLFGDNYLSALCYFQLILSSVSVVLLYITMQKLTGRRFISLSVTALYGLCNAVIGWDKAILTESLSISFSVIIIWGIVLYLKKNSKKAIIIAIIVATIGCFLRAVFAIYAGLIFGFLILRLIFPGKNLEKSAIKVQRLSDLKCSAVAVVPVVLLLVYAAGFSNQHGAFTLSDSGLGQQVATVLTNDYHLDSQDEEIKEIAEMFLNSATNEGLTSAIDSSIDSVYKKAPLTEEAKEELAKAMYEYYAPDGILDKTYEQEMNTYFSNLYQSDYTCNDGTSVYIARCYIMNNFSRDRIDSFVSECMKNHFKSHILSFVKNTNEEFKAYQTPAGNSIASLLNSLLDSTVFFLHITLLQGMIIGFFELVIFVTVLIRKKLVDWVHLGLAAFILSTGLLALMGTNAEFARTSITMIPFMFVSVGLWVKMLFSRFVDKSKG